MARIYPLGMVRGFLTVGCNELALTLTKGGNTIQTGNTVKKLNMCIYVFGGFTQDPTFK